jgi:hypothetical protein
MARIGRKIDKAADAVGRRAGTALAQAEKAVAKTRKSAGRTMEDAADNERAYAKDIKRKTRDPEMQRKLKTAGKAAAAAGAAVLAIVVTKKAVAKRRKAAKRR